MNINKSHVEATPAFKKLDPLQQKLILKKDVFEQIKNGVSVVGFKGLEVYKREHNPHPRVLTIITEILLNQ